jgi:hypothetical protein
LHIMDFNFFFLLLVSMMWVFVCIFFPFFIFFWQIVGI